MKFFLLCVFTVFHFAVFGQSNIKAGYQASIFRFDGVDQMVDAYNIAHRDQLDKPMSSLAFVQGVSVGYRYRWALTAVELDYAFRFKIAESEAVEAQESIRMTNRQHSFGFGVLQYFSESASSSFNLGIMPSIRYTFYQLDGRRGGRNNSSLLRFAFPSYRVALHIDLPSAIDLGVSIQPYVEYVFGEALALGPLSDYLAVSAASGKLPMAFGLQVVLYNGYQP